MKSCYDFVIVGGGIYGLYAATRLAERHRLASVCLIEAGARPFMRASFVNQARVHNGYHYPRSLATAAKLATYFQKFNDQFHSAINRSFDKIYATAAEFSYTSADQFLFFCNNAGIPCEEVSSSSYFRAGLVDGAFKTVEFAFSAEHIKDYFVALAQKLPNLDICYQTVLGGAQKAGSVYLLKTSRGDLLTPFVLNSTYAGTNQVLHMLGFKLLDIKYEICEVILCNVSSGLQKVGITVMDGPFFSIMPFGFDGHSITAVMTTPHTVCYKNLPVFACQSLNPNCSPAGIDNCNECPARPSTAFSYMRQLAAKFLRDEFDVGYKRSIFAIKPILSSSEVDDSRPTVIRCMAENPYFYTVLSGKINTIYDLDEVLP